MQLFTPALQKRFDEVGSQDGKGGQAIVIAKFFNPYGAGTWYATEVAEYQMIKETGATAYANSPEERERRLAQGYKVGDVVFFGYVSIFGDHCDEWGDFLLSELTGYRSKLGSGIERDLYCGEKSLASFFKDGRFDKK